MNNGVPHVQLPPPAVPAAQPPADAEVEEPEASSPTSPTKSKTDSPSKDKKSPAKGKSLKGSDARHLGKRATSTQYGGQEVKGWSDDDSSSDVDDQPAKPTAQQVQGHLRGVNRVKERDAHDVEYDAGKNKHKVKGPKVDEWGRDLGNGKRRKKQAGEWYWDWSKKDGKGDWAQVEDTTQGYGNVFNKRAANESGIQMK